MRPAWIEVDITALKKNIRNLKKCTAEDVEFMGVIKADAYGHGALKVAQVLREENVKRFAVVIIEEGIQLREAGFTEPILILGHTLAEDYRKLIEYDLIPIIYQYSQALKLSEAARQYNKKVKVHLKIDTGMGRLGFIPDKQAINDIKKINNLAEIELEGISTHLSTADQIKGKHVQQQFKKFMDFTKELEKEGIKIPLKHVANSAATINFPKMHLDMVRPGTSLYGLYPGQEMRKNPTIDLYPVMSIKAKLVHIKRVPPGTGVSYGRTFVTKKDSVLGIVPLGYVDGVFRLLANRGEVLVHGQRCPMVGTICMDQFMIDVTEVEDVQAGDEVVFLGEQGQERITADEIGALAGTISIEVVTRLGKRMPLVYKE